MFRIPEIRRWREQAGSDQQFVLEVCHGLGLCDQTGLRHTDDGGNLTLDLRVREGAQGQMGQAPRGERGFAPRDFSVKMLAEAIIGEGWDKMFHPGVTTQRIRVAEAGPIGISPTMFADINTYVSTVSGLLERRILEMYVQPAYIGDELYDLQTTGIIAGQKRIGIAQGGDQAVPRLPTQAIKMATLGERWSQDPDTRENSLGVELSVEAVSQDLSGQLMEASGDIGKWVRYRKEIEQLQTFMGVLNPWNYKGTAYNTYQTATPYVNDFSNPFVDWLDYNDANTLLWNMRDLDNGVPIQVEADTVVCMPGMYIQHNAWSIGDMQQRRTQTQAEIVQSRNQFAGRYRILTSNLLYFLAQQQATDNPAGLGLNAANALQYWWLCDPKRAMVYVQNEPFTTQAAIPSSYEMLSRRVVLAQFAWERGISAVKGPQWSVRSKN